MKSIIHRQPLADLKPGVDDGPSPDATHSTCTVFMPDILRAMGDGFDLAWTAMLSAKLCCESGYVASETRHQLALAIVEAARSGSRDCLQLSENALRNLHPSAMQGNVVSDKRNLK